MMPSFIFISVVIILCYVVEVYNYLVNQGELLSWCCPFRFWEGTKCHDHAVNGILTVGEFIRE